MSPSPSEYWQGELVLDARALLGEGPVWDAAASVLYWVDIDRCLVHRFDPATGEDETMDAVEPAGAVVPRAAGGLALARKSGFAFVERWGAPPRTIAAVETDRLDTRMNDGACDRRGRFWAGTMETSLATGKGSLYRLERDGSVTRVLADVTCSNGIGWSLDDRTMFYVDTGKGAVDAFDFDLESGAISRRRRVVEVDRADGLPDGLVVDAEGCLWVALWEGWAVHRYAPDGTLLGAVEMPAARLTKCAFGGPALDELYVTTAAPDEPDPRQPHAGGIFLARPGVAGQPATPFAG